MLNHHSINHLVILLTFIIGVFAVENILGTKIKLTAENISRTLWFPKRF